VNPFEIDLASLANLLKVRKLPPPEPKAETTAEQV